MKKYVYLVLVGGMFASCGNVSDQEVVTTDVSSEEIEMAVFGDQSITAEGAMAVSELPVLIEGKDSLQIKLNGVINECCQTKGCWMTMDMGNGEEMMVRFKDYEFFVPKDAGGKECVIEGVAKVEEITVAELQHYAQDAGKSEEEIAAITEPERKMSFTASGVIIL